MFQEADRRSFFQPISYLGPKLQTKRRVGYKEDVNRDVIRLPKKLAKMSLSEDTDVEMPDSMATKNRRKEKRKLE